MTNIVLCGGMRKDPKVGGGVEFRSLHEELARFCPYSKLEVDGRSKCSKFESGLKPMLKMMFGHQEISDFPTLVKGTSCTGREKVGRFKMNESLTPHQLVAEDILHRGRGLLENSGNLGYTGCFSLEREGLDQGFPRIPTYPYLGEYWGSVLGNFSNSTDTTSNLRISLFSSSEMSPKAPCS
ncbi:hypothetical protein Lal_00039364 [Lupinus albus]|nr:hypothetical protein Lal_00039364 [Lupinus albus]